jgi:iron complex transport system substrate-binding protein
MRLSRDLVAVVAVVTLSCLLPICSFRLSVSVNNNHDHTVDVTQVTDASGQIVQAGNYQRIVCASSIASQVVPELIESQRIVMVDDWYAKHSPQAFQLSNRPTLASLESVEAILAVHPDLVIINNFTMKPEVVARLRERELTVLDLGQMLGLQSLLPSIRMLGIVLRQPQRAEKLAFSITRRLDACAAHVAPDKRKNALFLMVMGNTLLGATKPSSFHDLLIAAGLNDVAADRGYPSFPQYTLEDLLTLNPDLIITQDGAAAGLRALPGSDRLHALQTLGNLIELPNDMDTTGPHIVECAEDLCDRVYGPPPQRRNKP